MKLGSGCLIRGWGAFRYLMFRLKFCLPRRCKIYIASEGFEAPFLYEIEQLSKIGGACPKVNMVNFVFVTDMTPM